MSRSIPPALNRVVINGLLLIGGCGSTGRVTATVASSAATNASSSSKKSSSVTGVSSSTAESSSLTNVSSRNSGSSSSAGETSPSSSSHSSATNTSGAATTSDTSSGGGSDLDASTDAGGTFVCAQNGLVVKCSLATQYCSIVGMGPGEATVTCEQAPSSCDGHVTCLCVTGTTEACVPDAGGVILRVNE